MAAVADECCGTPPLLGHVIGVTGDRRVDELTAHLRSLGADVVHGPMVRTRAVRDDDGALRTATDRVIARPPHYLLATTGIGVRSWINSAATWGARDALLGALGGAKVLARGPKVVGALYEAGLPVWFSAPSGRTMSLVDHLLTRPVAGARIAVQMPGDDVPEVVDRLRSAGADVTTIASYDWTWPEDLAPSRRLLREIVQERVSAVTFTSRPAVRNLMELARTDGLADDVRRSMQTTVLPVCVGAVTAEAVRVLIGAQPREPDRALLGVMVQTLVDELTRREHRHLRVESGDDVILQRRHVSGRGVAVTMSDREAALLGCLVGDRRRTIGRDALLRAVWDTEQVDPSVLETTMARLRRRLAATGLVIETISGRGYLLQGRVVPCTRALGHGSDSAPQPVTAVRP